MRPRMGRAAGVIMLLASDDDAAIGAVGRSGGTLLLCLCLWQRTERKRNDQRAGQHCG